jgi:hypothetical protein
MKHLSNLFSLFLFLLILTHTQTLKAQTIEVQWGPVLKNDSKNYPMDIIGKDESGFFQITYRSRDYYIEKFSNAMTLIFSHKLEVFVAKGKPTTYENVVYLKGKIIYFSSYYDDKNSTRVLFGSYISTTTGIAEPKLYSVASFLDQPNKRSMTFDASITSDSSKILIISNIVERSKEENERFNYTIIDDAFNKLANSFIELPYAGVNCRITDYIVDNNNNVHMLYRLNLKKEGLKESDDDVNFAYYLFSYYSSDKSTVEYNLKVGDNVVSGIDIKLDKKNEYLYIPGFYSNKSEYGFKGTFISKIDIQNKKVVYSKTKDFTADFLALFYKKPETTKAGKKVTKELYDYIPRFIHITENGEVFVVSEQYWLNVVTSTQYVSTGNGGGYTTTTRTYYYHYNHLIAVNFNSDGDVAWTAKIPKLQLTTNDAGFYSSIATFVHKDKLYMIYNDNPKNGTSAEVNYTMSQPLKSQTIITSIDNNGNIEKNVLFKEQDRAAVVRPKFTVQISPEEVIVYSVRGKQYKFGKLVFKD